MTIVLSIVPLFLSLAIAVFAGLQWRLARTKLRLDLFDRRYKVYDAAKKLLTLVLREAKLNLSDLTEFNIAVADAEFLFESDVLNYLKGLRKSAIHLNTTQKLLSRPQTDDQLKKTAEAEEKDLTDLTNQLAQLTKAFRRYLGFADITSFRRMRSRD